MLATKQERPLKMNFMGIFTLQKNIVLLVYYLSEGFKAHRFTTLVRIQGTLVYYRSEDSRHTGLLP